MLLKTSNVDLNKTSSLSTNKMVLSLILLKTLKN